MENSDRVLESFRRWGYLQADLDPLGRLPPMPLKELEAAGPAADLGRKTYCGPIGVEFMHIADPERRRWVAERMEGKPPEPDRERILEQLVRAKVFETYLHNRYTGTKRFSIEGVTSLIPLLAEVLEAAAERGAGEAVLGMSHRGRLNVMAHILGKRAADIFAGFEDVDPRTVLGSGDVKYHIGATGRFAARGGRGVHISLISNPSHLEAVDPVVLGRARAKQERCEGGGRARVLPITLHGDAAFAGQGIAAESLNLANLRGFTAGGAVHVIVNNLIGFTAEPRALHSSRFASDVARRLDIPIFHVNARDPEAVVRAARMATEYRYAFWSDVVVDLIGYRLHGHSEIDDPTITQPLLYRKIKDLPAGWEAYAGKIRADRGKIEASIAEIRKRLDEEHERARKLTATPLLREFPGYWSGFIGGRWDAAHDLDTGVPAERLREIAARIAAVPDGFAAHPKALKLLEQRAEMGAGGKPADWGAAEALAFGSLLWDGIRVRLSGQDSRRGTFNQRHAALFDRETGEEHIPLRRLHPGQGVFDCYDSPLSEAAALGFEYGYSRDHPEALVMWEAQFGDFSNGAQVIIDQFISAGEDKWGLLSGLVMLLPHGYEGQGPEHSSARIERFLRVAAEDNMQICQPSTAAQYFHLLRRQALMRWRKPLVVFTPKSLLRHPAACSPIEEMARGRFRWVISDGGVSDARRLILCSGKIAHELRQEREKRGDRSTAIAVLEQLYPFPEEELAGEIARHAGAREILWVQEEPANMGALSFVQPIIQKLAGKKPLRTVKRSASASPATGSSKASALEQATLISLAFDLKGSG